MIEFKLPAVADGQPAFEGRFGRVNVILGANGSGKSRLVKRLTTIPMASFPGATHVIFIEGGRAITPPADMSMLSMHQIRTLEQAEEQHKNQRRALLANRINAAFLRIALEAEVADHETATALRTWQRLGKVGDPPEAASSPVEKVSRLFNEIFPDLQVRYTARGKTLSCFRTGVDNPYPPTSLSDGEKQVLCLLTEIAVLGDQGAFVVVDEPELNLHTSLAIRLWDVIEGALRDSFFTYATHNVAFAMRPSVESVVVISAKKQPLYIEHTHDIPEQELREFLGAAPAMLNTDTLLAVEGNDRSFDTPFYRWLVGEPGLSVAAVGDCNAVQSVTKVAGVWAQSVKAGVRTLGVVDRDYRDSATVEKLEADGVIVLPFHEAESLLCYPKLLAALAIEEPAPTEDLILEKIIAYAQVNALRIAVRRVSARYSLTLDLSIERAELAGVTSISQAAVVLAKHLREECAKVPWQKEDTATALIGKEYDMIIKAIETNDVESLLRLVPGKELLNQLAKPCGYKSGRTLLNDARRHVCVALFPEIISTRKLLRAGLGLPDSSLATAIPVAHKREA